MVEVAGVAIFAVMYGLLAARRLAWGRVRVGRPAVALACAAAVVAFGVLTPEQAVAAVDGPTLLLLVGVMGMGAFLAVDGFFARAEGWLGRRVRTRAGLLACVVWGAGLLAPWVTNDAVCLLGAPLVVGLVRRYRLPALPFLIGLATAANTGSVATLVGNPQNMLCGALGGLSYGDYLAVGWPAAVVGLGINHLLVWGMFRGALAGALADGGAAEAPPEGPLMRAATWWTCGALLGTAVAFAAGADLAWTAVAGWAALLVVLPGLGRRAWREIDWSVLGLFVGLFVVTRGFEVAGAADWLFARVPIGDGVGVAGWAQASGVMLVGSNVVSNVPFVLLAAPEVAGMARPQAGWELLAVASTFAGNLTFLGSVANILVAEKARDVGGMGFWAYLRVGFPVAVLSTAAGAAWVWWLRVA